MPYLNTFGQTFKTGSTYVAIIMFIFGVLQILFLLKIKIFDMGIFKILFIFHMAIWFSFFINFEDIYENYYMGNYGISRFFFQYLLLNFGIFSIFYFAQAIDSKEELNNILLFNKFIVFIFLLFGLFQFFVFYYQGSLFDIYKIIGSLIYPENHIDYMFEHRPGVYSFTQEPSHLAMYLAVTTPYITSYAFITKRYYWILIITLVSLLSFSRLGYVIIFLQILIINYLVKYQFISFKKFLYLCILIFSFFLFLSNIPFVNEILLSLFDYSNIGSNAARYTAVYSAIMTWVNHNLLVGVGLGQTGFYSFEYLPSWGFLSGDVIDTDRGVRWPPIHNLLVRILTEIGILGLLTWMSLFGYVILTINNILTNKSRINEKTDWIGIGAFTSIIGSIMIMFNDEKFTNMNLWFSLGMALSYININKQYKSKSLGYHHEKI